MLLRSRLVLIPNGLVVHNLVQALTAMDKIVAGMKDEAEVPQEVTMVNIDDTVQAGINSFLGMAFPRRALCVTNSIRLHLMSRCSDAVHKTLKETPVSTSNRIPLSVFFSLTLTSVIQAQTIRHT